MPGTRVEGRGTVFRGLASRGLTEKGAFENLRRRSGETLPGRKSSSSKALSQGLLSNSRNSRADDVDGTGQARWRTADGEQEKTQGQGGLEEDCV